MQTSENMGLLYYMMLNGAIGHPFVPTLYHNTLEIFTCNMKIVLFSEWGPVFLIEKLLDFTFVTLINKQIILSFQMYVF